MALLNVLTDRLTKWKLLDEPEAAAALDLARRIDAVYEPAAAAMLHAQLGNRLSELRKLAPIEEVGDDIDALKAQIHLLPRAEESG